MKYTIDFSTQQGGAVFDRLAEKFTEYLRYTSKSMGEAVQHHAKEVTEQMFLLTPRAVASVIRAKLESLGWRFKRAPKGYAAKFRNKVGGSANAEVKAKRSELWSKLNVVRKPRQKQTDAIREAMAANPEVAQAFRKANRLTLEEQRAAAYNFRVGHIGSMAASWIPALKLLGSKMRIAAEERKIDAKQRPKSSVEIRDAGKFIRVTNRQNGLVALALRTGFIDGAFAARRADMEVYIARKQREGMTIFNPSGAR